MPKLWFISFSVLAAAAIFVALILLYYWVSRRKNKYSPFTEDSLRLPGHTVRLKQLNISDEILMLYVQFIFAFVSIPYFFIFLIGSLRFVLPVIVVVYVFFLARKVWSHIGSMHNYALGRKGEEYTGQELNLLMRSGAFVFHDIPYKYGNIDHIVVGRNAVFAVETKAVRKPQSQNSNSKEFVVEFDGKTLKFPNNKTTDKPVKQALRHAEFLSEIIGKKCKVKFPVIAVVALPGWKVHINAKFQDVLVINPKRGKALRSWLGELHDKESRDRVTAYIASVARSVDYFSNKTDPDASDNYDFWLNPRVQEKALGD